MVHLLSVCSFSRLVSHEVLSWLRLTASHPNAEDDFADWWLRTCCSVQTSAQKGMASAIMLVAWCI